MADALAVGGAPTTVTLPGQIVDVDDIKFEGKTQGELVVMEAATKSLIQQAAEQSQLRRTDVERTLAQRQATSASSAALAKMLAKFKEDLPDLPAAEKFHKLLKEAKSAEPPSREALEELLKENFGDIAHRDAALAFLEDSLVGERGRRGANDELLRLVRESRRELTEQHGDEIRAAHNISRHAAEHAELGNIGELRDLYRQTVVGYGGLSQAYDEIVKRYGPDRFSSAIDFLISSLGKDISAESPSRDAGVLKATLDDLYFVQVARNSFESCRIVLDKLKQQFGASGIADAHAVLKELLSLKDQRFIDPEKIQSLSDRVGVRDHEPRIYFQRELHTVVRRLPDKIFQNHDERIRLADAVQAALDRSIREEGL